ncbi:MAG: rod shape-determining protein MreD [Chitinophagaceae bacterium]|nr:MAG: rod shape-determining protein MreD [Chitinophagaceae bacterium]
MSDLLKNILRFAVFILVQVYVLDEIPPLHRYIIPYIYYLFILWLPFSVSRFGLLVIGFLTGLALDYFTNTPGLHAAACLLIAYVRPFLINILTPKDPSEFNYREPSPKAMGWTPYLVYVLVLTIFHHLYLTFLEYLDFGSFIDFVVKVLSTTAISMLLVIVTELLFTRKMKYRTNTA